MKNGKIRIIVGWFLVVIQIVSWLGMSSANTKLWNDADDTYQHISTSDSELNFSTWFYAFEIGNEKFTNSFSNLFVAEDEYISLTSNEFASIYIRESLGAGERDFSFGLVLFDFNILISYLFYGIMGVILLVFGNKARSKEKEIEGNLDKVETTSSKNSKTICIVLLFAAIILPLFKLPVVYVIESITPTTISFVFLIIFFIFYLGKKKSVLLPSAIILFAIDSILYLFVTISNWFYWLFMDMLDVLALLAFPTLVLALLSLVMGICYLICGIKLYSGKEKSSIKKLNAIAMIFAVIESLLCPILLTIVYDPLLFNWIDISNLAFAVVVTIYIVKIPCDNGDTVCSTLENGNIEQANLTNRGYNGMNQKKCINCKHYNSSRRNEQGLARCSKHPFWVKDDGACQSFEAEERQEPIVEKKKTLWDGIMGLFRKKKNPQEEFLKLFKEALQDAKENAQTVGTLFNTQQPDRSDFGLSETNPVFGGSLSGTENYLSRLCTKDGRKFTWSRSGEVRATVRGQEDVGEDVYTLYLNGEKYTDLYFVLYVGESEFPPAGLYFYGDGIDWDLKREAFEKGVTVEQLIEIRQMEEENRKLKQKMEQEFKQTAAHKSESIKNKYPTFSLETELQNPVFSFLVNADCDLIAAYEYCHREELNFKKREKDSLFTDPYTEEFCFNLMYKIENEERQQASGKNEQSMADLQKEAEERGLELNQLIEIRTMEKENAELKWQMRLKELKRFAEQAVKAQDDFPEFDLSIEWKNLIFRQITGRFGMLVAYEITHFHECYFQEQQSQTIPEQIVEEAERLFCRKCGTQLLTDSVYCNKCGTKVETL